MNETPRTETFQLDGTKMSGVGPPLPSQIGRYRVERILGQGGFGLVYLAYDDQLGRPVAIKVPHSKLISKPEDAEIYLTEARTVANLDHPNIVAVHDVGSTTEFPCYVVSKFIDGTDLASRLKQSRLNLRESVELVSTVAEALHYAHKQGLVHRDVKPGNILIDKSGKAFVADFGLALREKDAGKGPRYAGTPAYMSPEQARGEGHRVDGRSDIFSLGVVFYELLVAQKPFRADSLDELLEQITSFEPRPPRQYDDHIPKELDRICLKALPKRASERYSTARDMAEDLRHFLAEQTINQQSSPIAKGTGSPAITPVVQPPSIVGSSATSVTPTPPNSDHQLVKIVPKGLRSFDAHDADFFLELLPGPRDRGGLPDSIRFWKTRIEEKDADASFSVGLIYGPSGCGKSSLVKAGLLPRLSEDVIPIYVEATAEETESRLLNRLRKHCTALSENLGLKETLATLRRGQGIPSGKKVFIVLDQFEQWLHAKKDEPNTELVQALRQCDGGRVQCIVMVRDDFWMAVTRFLTELEIDLIPERNIAAADLFDLRHTKNVLTAFGSAFGTLPAHSIEQTAGQRAFIEQVVSGLAQEGKVVCVRLALFAEMMKGKPWTPVTLKEVGGTEGIGVTFLEETFSSQSANPKHRLHQKAARAVLMALLPESGANIKGQMKSYDELMEASGFARRPKDFEDLIRILDSEIRLITPTDPEGQTETSTSSSLKIGQRYYQLTHDYLVPSLRDWLTSKQKETRRGRAELLLADRAAAWNARQENRQLPSILQWFDIWWWTQKKNWKLPQKKMMSKASRVHGFRGTIAAVLLAGMMFAGASIRSAVLEERSRTQARIRENENTTRAEELVASLLKADIVQVPAIISGMTTYRDWADPILRTKIAKSGNDSTEKLVLAMALLPVDDSQIEYLREQLPVCTLEQLPVVRKALLSHKDNLTDELWRVVQDEQREPGQRFQAAAVLAEYVSDDERWQQTAPFVVQHLTNAVPTVHVGQWRQLLQAASTALTDPLIAIHADRDRSDKQREAAAFVLSAYLANQPEKLVDVVLVTEELAEYSPLVEALKLHAEAVKRSLLLEMQSAMPVHLAKTNDKLSEGDQQLRDARWKRQSLAAVTLVQFGFGDEVWPLLNFSPDLSLRSFIIHHLGKLGTNHNTLAFRLEAETEVSIRRALIQSLGGLDSNRIPLGDRNRIISQLHSMYINDPDPGVHGSTSWTLRKWGVALPELPVGEPVLTEEQKTQLAKLTAKVENVRQRIVTSEKNLPERQAEWERQLREQSAGLPVSLSQGLVAHYAFDETEGKEAANTVKSQPGGVYAGIGEPEWVPGVLGHAVRLNGKGGHFTCGEVFHPDRSDSFSCGCWYFADEKSIRGVLLGKFVNSSERGFAVNVDPIGNDFICEWHHHYPENSLQVRWKAANLVGRWSHLLVTYDGSSTAAGVKVYVDGHPVPLNVNLDRLSESVHVSAPLQIGQRDGRYAFWGSIDDVRIYNRSLSPKDVEELYQAGVRDLAGIPSEIRTPEQQSLLTETYRPLDEPVQRLKSQLRAAETDLSDARLNSVRRWYVNSQGQTMTVIPTPAADRKIQISMGFAISSHEVTVAEFRRFREKHGLDRITAPTDNCPVHNLTWFEAAEYCNWLSKQESIPEDQWIYQPNDGGQFENGMKLKEQWPALMGYRLPTNAEWYFACCSETGGSYGFGEPVSLLKNYGWHGANSSGYSYSVELLLPNEAGLFDLHGNVWEWVQNPVAMPLSPITSRNNREIRGGSFTDRSADVRSDHRLYTVPTKRLYNLGLRMVRTMPVVAETSLTHKSHNNDAKKSDE